MSESALADRVGPFLSRSRLAEELGWTEAEVTTAAQDLVILEVPTEEGIPVYPADQVRDGQLPPGLQDVLHVLATGSRHRWTWGLWLLNPTANPNNPDMPRCHMDLLFDGHLAWVLREATRTAQAWKA